MVRATSQNGQRGKLKLSTRTKTRQADPVAHASGPAMQVLEDRLLMTQVNWINPAGGDWDVAANWSNKQLPGAGDDVTINVAGNVTIRALKKRYRYRQLRHRRRRGHSFGRHPRHLVHAE